MAVSIGAPAAAHPADRDVICRPESAPRAALVYLHGGAFLIPTSEEDLRVYCQPFADEGYLTVAVDYPICEPEPGSEGFSYPGAYRHVVRAVRRLEKGGLPVYAYGDSAGGTLAEMLAVQNRVAGAVAAAAPADLLTWAAGNRRYWRLLRMSRAERRAASPLHRIGRRSSPLLLLHSPDDEIVPFDQSRRLASALSRARLIRLTGEHGEDPQALRIGLRWLSRRTRSPYL